MFAKLTLAAAFAAALFAAPSAQAFSRSSPTQTVSRVSMTAILQSMNMKVEDATDKDDADDTPWLTVTTKSGRIFNVFLYVCTDKSVPTSPCEQLQYRILWDNTNGRTAADVNRFHLEKVYGRGYVTEDGKSLGLEYAMHLKGGVTIENIKENTDYFLRVVDDFVEIVKP